MTTTQHLTRTSRLSVAALLCTGALALTAPMAHAEPGNGNGASSSSDPAGNNGTVKIAPFGDVDSIPHNTPHVGCTFQLEWYGFDEGADIVSTVLFESQAPTADSVISGTDPSQVFVGGDPASGAGTETGFDGSQDYTLSFTGAPHPQQGYHVKLTITTPGSIGNDTKTKVFWVEGCETTPPTTPPTSPETPVTPTTPETPSTPTTPTTPESPQAPEVLPEVGTETPTTPTTPTTPNTTAPEVLGEQAFAADAPQAPAAAQQSQPQAQAPQALPTSVNAGAAGTPADDHGTTPLLGLLLVLLGAVSARLGWLRARG